MFYEEGSDIPSPAQEKKTRYQAGLIAGFMNLLNNTMALSGPVVSSYLL
jgi:hypothetical protein